MHPLIAERERIASRIVERKKAIRQIRIRLGMDAAELAKVDAQCRALGIRAIPITTRGEEETHGPSHEDDQRTR